MYLLKHFKELTVRPKNAQELKGLILQLAVQGNLTSRWREENPDVENAKQIYQRINEEREALINNRKIKLRDIKPIQETLDMRFNLPKSWEWFSFSDVVFYQEGPGIRTWQFRDTGVKLLNVQNIVGDTLVLDNTEKHVDKVEFDEKYRHFKVESGDLLFAGSGGSWGKSAWFKDPGYDVMMNTSMIRLKFYSKEWFPEYLKYFLSSIFFKKQLECQLVGIQPNFGSTHLGRSFIPIPPIEEQKAIVEVVEALFKEVEQLEQLTVERITLKEKFVTSALNQLSTNNTTKEWAFLKDHFHNFFNETTNIKKLRETVLQLAVQGKLTADWRANNPNIEDASLLLKRIQKEKAQLIKDKKIKKEKPLPPITKDEIPYELPKGWVWEYLGASMLKITDGTHHSPTNVENGDFKYVSAKNIKAKGVKLSNITYVTEEAHKEIYARCNPELGDLLYIKDGATTGVCCINNLDEEFSMLSSVALIKLPKEVLNEYLLRVFRSPYYYDLMRKGMTGVAITRVTLTKLKASIIPIPPIEEQKAIVQKVNSLMGLCDALEQQVRQSQEQSEKLMQSVLREVFEGKALEVIENA